MCLTSCSLTMLFVPAAFEEQVGENILLANPGQMNLYVCTMAMTHQRAVNTTKESNLVIAQREMQHNMISCRSPVAWSIVPMHAMPLDSIGLATLEGA